MLAILSLKSLRISFPPAKHPIQAEALDVRVAQQIDLFANLESFDKTMQRHRHMVLVHSFCCASYDIFLLMVYTRNVAQSLEIPIVVGVRFRGHIQYCEHIHIEDTSDRMSINTIIIIITSLVITLNVSEVVRKYKADLQRWQFVLIGRFGFCAMWH